MNKLLTGVYGIALVLVSLVYSTSTKASTAYEGHQIFNKYCFVCHGTKGSGDGPLANNLEVKPANLTDHNKMSKRSDKDLFRIIQGTASHAKINGAMPQWGLAIPGTQIKSLVSYIRFLHKSDQPVIGDPSHGADIYAKSCTACHGDSGKGDGVMTNVLNMTPVDHTDTGRMSKMSNKLIHRSISKGTGKFMPGWSGTLSKDDIDSLTGYIRLLSY